ncbi:histidinol-phosphate transaminase [uncultured Thiodictyon sp.]|jgi:histidinol-phosphate aminotransferase|uniref:pyridoxal phosphate-dependent aminotransferase n=1 Tax=uncultured Thiodictyon sp. TaxID=1846217 RepID=UPI0025D635D7|nr:histidinol-phosphate transaminase [uncultured Thiodictyon sp.]
MSAPPARPPVDLSANENPLGPSPKALAALAAAMGGLHRYPDRACTRLKAALALRLGVSARQIAIGNGSCEVLDLAVRGLIAPGEKVILGTPGFPAYRGAVRRAGGQAVLVPARDYRDDLTAMLGQIDSRTRLLVLGNPGNPTGTLIGRTALLAFLDRLPAGVTLILDEAYRDFVADASLPDAVDLLQAGRPVVALRSFSKVHGLAGLRVGYAVATPDLIARMQAEHQQFNTNTLAQAAALAALEDEAHVAATIELNRRGREELFAGLAARGFDPVPSQANFVLVRVGDGAGLVLRLAAQGVLVKELGRYGLDDHIRVSCGRAPDHARFFAALDAVWPPRGGNGWNTRRGTHLALDGDLFSANKRY